MKILQKALEDLNNRISAGQEFPDAAWATCCAYKVDYYDLVAAYDNQ